MGKVGTASWSSPKKSSAQQGTESSRMGGIAIAPCSPIYEGRPLQRYKYRNGDYIAIKLNSKKLQYRFFMVHYSILKSTYTHH